MPSEIGETLGLKSQRAENRTVGGTDPPTA
jgi:hypothetical protein